MLNQHHRCPKLVINVEHKAAHVLLFLNVHAGHGLIQQQHLRLHGQRSTQVHPLLQAVGQHAHRRFAVSLNFQKINDLFNRFPVHHFFFDSRANAQGLQQDIAFNFQIATRHDVVEHAHTFEQCKILKGTRHPHHRHLVTIHVLESLTPKRDRALLRLVHAVDAVQHRAFARAVGANDGAYLMLSDIERNVLQRLDTSKRERNIVHVKDDVTDFLAHAAAFTAAKVLQSPIFNVALTLPLRPSSNFTTVSMNCSVLPLYSASISG